MEHIDCEFAIPERYQEIYHIDASDKKTAIKMTLGALAILVVMIALLFVCADLSKFDFSRILLYDGIWIAAMLVYIVLHELVHGAVYKALIASGLRLPNYGTVLLSVADEDKE